MRRLILILLGIIPMILIAQNKCDLFKNIEVSIEKTELNTSASDFGPAFVGDELWYSAFTKDEIEKMATGVKKGIYYNLYHSEINIEGDDTGASVLDLEKVSEGYHAGPVSWCAETQELFVTLNNYDNPEIRNKVYRKADIGLRIVVVKKEGGEWAIKEELPFNNSGYSVGHPAVSASGDTLYFASNAPGKGEGRTDLFMSVRNNGVWGDMINLGEKINTPGDDMFPFLYKGNTLIFASNGHEEGKSDLDLYYSCMENGSFSAPQKLDELNSDGDDFGLVIHVSDDFGYMASDRSGGAGSDDIYKVELVGQYDLELTVLDRATGTPVENVVVSFSDGVDALKEGSVYKRGLANGATVIVTSASKGYVDGTKSISTKGKPYGTIEETLLMDQVKKDLVVELENIFYDFDKWDILPESEMELNRIVKLMKEYPEMQIEMRSHTDCRGSDSYNDKLSQKRSDSAMGYILKNGIEKNRIIAKGYGETMLVNHCDDGVSCSEDEHRKNRRTEFKILKVE